MMDEGYTKTRREAGSLVKKLRGMLGKTGEEKKMQLVKARADEAKESREKKKKEATARLVTKREAKRRTAAAKETKEMREERKMLRKRFLRP